MFATGRRPLLRSGIPLAVLTARLNRTRELVRKAAQVLFRENDTVRVRKYRPETESYDEWLSGCVVRVVTIPAFGNNDEKNVYRVKYYDPRRDEWQEDTFDAENKEIQPRTPTTIRTTVAIQISGAMDKSFNAEKEPIQSPTPPLSEPDLDSPQTDSDTAETRESTPPPLVPETLPVKKTVSFHDHAEDPGYYRIVLATFPKSLALADDTADLSDLDDTCLIPAILVSNRTEHDRYRVRPLQGSLQGHEALASGIRPYVRSRAEEGAFSLDGSVREQGFQCVRRVDVSTGQVAVIARSRGNAQSRR